MLNEIFGNVELSEEEMQTLIWLAGWAENTVENVVSAIRKAMTADAKRRELPPRQRTYLCPAGLQPLTLEISYGSA